MPFMKTFVNGPKTPWGSMSFHMPVLFIALLWNYVVGFPSVLTTIGLLALGVFIWTLVEYVMHAFPMHQPYKWWLFKFLREGHEEHHAAPQDPSTVFARPIITLTAAGMLLCIFRLVLPTWGLAALLLAGVAMGYLAYEVTHYTIHRNPHCRFLRPLVSHHFHHHYADSERCYGVTSPLWDFVFHTRRLSKSIQGQNKPV